MTIIVEYQTTANATVVERMEGMNPPAVEGNFMQFGTLTGVPKMLLPIGRVVRLTYEDNLIATAPNVPQPTGNPPLVGNFRNKN